MPTPSGSAHPNWSGADSVKMQNDEVQQYIVTIPEEFAGEVMGKLSAIGATLERYEKKDMLLKLCITSVASVMEGFDIWLSEATGGKGVIQ